MSALSCSCPRGLIRRDCEYHGHLARKALDKINVAWDQPGADPQSDLQDAALGGYRPDPPLIVQHYRKDPT